MTTTTFTPIPTTKASRIKLIRVLWGALVIVAVVVLASILLLRGSQSTHPPAPSRTGLQGGPAPIPATAAVGDDERVCRVGHLIGYC